MELKKNSNTKTTHTKGVDYVSTVIAQKWGNSLGIRIPKEAAEKIGISQGSEIELLFSRDDKTIILKPKKLQKKYTLDELISQITPENRHNEIDFGLEGRELI